MSKLDQQIRNATLALSHDTMSHRVINALTALEKRYREDQARIPQGLPGAGRWTYEGRPPKQHRVDVALAGKLIGQRTGVGNDRVIRMCTYEDFLGRQYSRELDASEPCPEFWVAPLHYGYR